jgi:hypothetical protein
MSFDGKKMLPAQYRIIIGTISCRLAHLALPIAGAIGSLPFLFF